MGWFVEIIPAKRREYLSIATVSGADGVLGHQHAYTIYVVDDVNTNPATFHRSDVREAGVRQVWQ